jgi:hypothetical protein
MTHGQDHQSLPINSSSSSHCCHSRRLCFHMLPAAMTAAVQLIKVDGLSHLATSLGLHLLNPSALSSSSSSSCRVRIKPKAVCLQHMRLQQQQQRGLLLQQWGFRDLQ